MTRFRYITAGTLAVSAILSTIAPTAVFAGGKSLPQNNGVKSEMVQCGNKQKPKNVIFMIGDGMGPSYTSAYRYMEDKDETHELDPVAFDHYLLGAQRTIADDDHENITDSAAAATAMSAGTKTYNNAIAVDKQKKEVKTVLEQAKKVGKATGLVATSEITHATPAAFGAHDISRKNMPQIADDYYDEMINGEHKVDIMLGGGKEYFERKDRNLVKAFQKDGYHYVTDKKSLVKAAQSNNQQILGLFSQGGMPKMIDRDENMPSLKDMTETALTKLKSDKDGFFLMIEGSQIDWAGHANDITGAMSEMRDFDLAFQSAINFAKKDCNTLVIATADHSTGGMSMGRGGEYNFLVDPIKQMKHTPEYLSAELLKKDANIDKIITENIGFELEATEIKGIKEAVAKRDAGKIEDAIEATVNKRSYTGWTTDGHTGEDVNVYGYGPGAQAWRGNMDNTDNAKRIFEYLKK